VRVEADDPHGLQRIQRWAEQSEEAERERTVPAYALFAMIGRANGRRVGWSATRKASSSPVVI
jgi:hypothetical protein